MQKPKKNQLRPLTVPHSELLLSTVCFLFKSHLNRIRETDVQKTNTGAAVSLNLIKDNIFPHMEALISVV